MDKRPPGRPPKQPVELTREQLIRLECLQLTYRPDKDAKYLIDLADKFAKYVEAGQVPQA